MGEAERETVRRERAAVIRQRLKTLTATCDTDRSKLSPLAEAAAALDVHVQEKTAATEAAQAVVMDARARYKQVRSQHKQETADRVRRTKLTAASLDMLRNNARRLEDAHAALKAAQADADALQKEHSLARDQQERLGANIEAKERAEVEAQDVIAHHQELIDQAKSGLERVAAKVERALADQAQRRADRVVAISEEVLAKRDHIQALRSSISDAVGDREDLAVAAVRVDQGQLGLASEREQIRLSIATLRAQSRDATGVQTSRSDRLKALLERKRVIKSEIDGHLLTIRALRADLKTRLTKMGAATDRIGHLNSQVTTIRSREDDAVERVADFQSWVERTQRAITSLDAQREMASTPEAPPPAPPSPPASKVDRLLAQLASQTMDAVPDPSAVPEIDGAATVMTDRDTLVAAHQDQEAATQILSKATLEEGDEDATEMFTPDSLKERLTAADTVDPEATVMMPMTRRRPPRTRDEDEGD